MKLTNHVSTLFLSLVALNVSALTGCTAESGDDEIDTSELAVGNGGPSGPHYNLNIIGVPKDKTATMTGNNGGRIFVKETGGSKIMLQEGADFQVLDANGTDGQAVFQLPNPDPDGDGVTAYSVWARALGTPGGSSTTTTCMEDGTETYCSTESMVLVRSTGGSKFDNVSQELLTVCLINDLGEEECGGLFSDPNMDYYWQYDNNGLKLAQCRFYPHPTDVSP